jgi:outer membrane protein TolC
LSVKNDENSYKPEFRNAAFVRSPAAGELMQYKKRLTLTLLGLAVFGGCSSSVPRLVSFQSHPADRAGAPQPLFTGTSSPVAESTAEAPTLLTRRIERPQFQSSADLVAGRLVSETAEQAVANQLTAAVAPIPAAVAAATPVTLTAPVHPATRPIQAASHESTSAAAGLHDATLTVEGRTWRVQLVEELEANRGVATTTANLENATALVPVEDVVPAEEVVPADPSLANAVQLDLATALSMIGGTNPAVGFAQWRVQEAYAELERAETLWLPSIQAGVTFNRHDGNYQTSSGRIADVNRNSFQYGFGAGAIGAGTSPIPGISARFHAADAIFEPRIAEKNSWARGHAANATVNSQLLAVALAYNELLAAEQDVRVVEESRSRTSDLEKITSDFALTGQGLQADADRLLTALSLVDSRLITAKERAQVGSTRLAQALSTDATRRILPTEPVILPVNLVPSDLDSPSLITTGLGNRPELKEAQALVAAACEEFNRQKIAPFVPSVLLGLSTSGFGGGLGSNIKNVDGRLDMDAMMTWEIRSLGYGEKTARNATQARIQQAKFEKVRLMDQVAQEVASAAWQSQRRRERIAVAEKAIITAERSYTRNVDRIRHQNGLPIEVLQSIRALETAQLTYLSAVSEYNEAQYRLQWALGWPVHTTR